MQRRRSSTRAWVVAAIVVAAGCGAEAGVRSTSSKAIPGPFDRNVPLTPVGSLPDISAADWQDCDDRDAPWQCTTIDVPVDYRDPEDGTIPLSLTRLPATSPDRIGSLVLNPGGPGGSGVQLAWDYADLFPTALLDRFDLVGFDPRGVGRSAAIDCGDLDRDYEVVMRNCVRNSGDLLPYVGTVNAARDLELLRIAIGDEQLTYLGFSYGTALGAVYANLFPSSVRALVLDGSVDPAAGEYNVDGTAAGSFGTPFYGVQDFYATEAVFHDLCDAVRSCPSGPTSARLLNDLYDEVDGHTVEYFPDWADEVTSWDVDNIVFSAMYNTDLWLPLAVALADAGEGDASTLAALASFLEAGYPRIDDQVDNLAEANLAIYCADFAGRGGRFVVDSCLSFPDSAEPLPPIGAVDVANPIVVIGTDGDPATPGFLAPEMAEALVDAVSIRWEGAGHTAFLNSECVDTAVIDYLIDLVVPRDRLRCAFAEGSDTRVARAEQVFELDRAAYRTRLDRTFVAEGVDADLAACLADGISSEGSPSVVVYARLGVQHPDYVQLRTTLEADCG